jgi:hypothetical protein
MAFTADQVQAAVERFLPRSLDLSRENGAINREKVVSRALEIAKTSLLFDSEASIASLSSAAAQAGEGLQSIIDALDKLTGNDLLLTLRDEAPRFTSDFSELEDAQTRLAQLSGALYVNESISQNHLDRFNESLDAFATTDLVPNVLNRNRVVIRDEAKAVYAELEPAWEDALAKKADLLLKVDRFLETDLGAEVAGTVIDGIQSFLDDTLAALDGATASEQSLLAESTLLDLSAARSVLQALQGASSPEGTEIVLAADGYTEQDYLQREGKGTPEPVDVVTLPSGARFASSGKIFLDPVTGGHGEAVDDADADFITPTFRDSSTDFVAEGVAVGHSLFLVKTGQSYRITAVATNDLTVTPEIPNDITSEDRYLVHEEIIGTYFKDATESFWTEYSDGETGSNVVVSGGGGIYPPDTRLEGTDGHNNKARNTSASETTAWSLENQQSGTKWPYKTTQSDFQVGGDPSPFTGAFSATAGIGTLIHEQNTGTGSMGVGTSTLTDSSVTDFTTLGISAGDVLTIITGADQGGWVVSSTTTSSLIIEGVFAGSISNDWRVDTTSNTSIRESSATFVTDGAVIGDYVAWKSETLGLTGVSQIRDVGETTIVLEDQISLALYTDICAFVYLESGVVSDTLLGVDYLYSDTSLASKVVAAGDIIRVTTGAAAGSYTAAGLVTGNIVQIEGLFAALETGTSTAFIHPEDYDELFYDPSGDFIADGVAVGDKLYLHEGSGSTTIGTGGETWTVSEVLSSDTLRVSSAFSAFNTEITWHISPDNELFFSTESDNVYQGILRDDLAETPGYKLVITTSSVPAHQGDYDLDFDPDDPNAGPELSLYWLLLSDTLVNQAGDIATYSDWSVVPQDDKTWFFAFATAWISKIDFFSFTDDESNPNQIGGSIDFGGRRDIPYLVRGADTIQVLTGAREDPYSVTSPAYTLRLAERVDVDPSSASWELWRGLTTDVFKDTTNSPFASAAVGDMIRLDPTGTPTDHVIIEVVSSSEVKIAPDLAAGQTGLTYVIFDSVKPGMELITGATRSLIVDIVDENVLKLATPLQASVGTGLTWFVVNLGTDISSSRLVDRDSSFLAANGFGTVISGVPTPASWLTGAVVRVNGIEAKVEGVSDLDGDLVCEAVILSEALPLNAAKLSYEVLNFEDHKTEFFKSGEDLSTAVAGDLLTVWGTDGVFEVVSSDTTYVEVTPRLPAELTAQTFAIVRSGTESWGRYLIFKDLLDALSLNPELDQLKLYLAEVVADFGGETKVEVVAVTAGGTLIDDDGDATTDVLEIPREASIQAGDQVFLDLSTDGEVFSYVKSAVHLDPAVSTLTLHHEFTLAQTVTEHQVVRNSVSYVLAEVIDRKAEVEAVQAVLSNFSVEKSPGIKDVEEVFTQLGMDKALDTLKAGDLDVVTALPKEEASYAASAAKAVNDFGRLNAPAGTADGTSDPFLTGPKEKQSGGSSPQTFVAQDGKFRIALGDLSAFLRAEARTQEASDTSLDDMIARSLYALNRELIGTFISDKDPTLPWIDVTGSRKDRIIRIQEAAKTALTYIIDNPTSLEALEDGS